MKKKTKIRLSLLLLKENWLNKMAANGYRLKKVGSIFCTFEKCLSNEKYQYCLEFIAPKSCKEVKNYIDFLNELGYRTLTQGINLNYSILKIRWRPYGHKWGQLSTKPGTYGKEILIVERQSKNEPFVLHSTLSDKADYCKTLRNAWLSLFIFCFFLSFWYTLCYPINFIKCLFLITISIFLFIPVCFYQKIIFEYKKKNITEE